MRTGSSSLSTWNSGFRGIGAWRTHIHLYVPRLHLLCWHGLHHAALDNLELQDRLRVTGWTNMQEKQPCRPHHAHLVLVTSLLNELIHYFLCLLVTFLLQVSDECVQMAGPVIRLYDRLMGLNDTSNTWRHKATPSEGRSTERRKQSWAPGPPAHPPAAVSECLQTQVVLSSLPDLLLLPVAGSPQL